MTKTYIFVVGTGRTGTTFLSDYLNAGDLPCLAYHEPRRTIKLLSNMYLSRKVSHGTMRRYLSSHRKWVDRQMAEVGATIYLQCDPWVYGFIPALDECFDQPYVIHTIRHPYTHIPSHLNRWYREAWVGWLRDHIPYWRLRAYRTGEMTRREWNDSTEIERVAWYWWKINSHIDQYHPELTNSIRVKYEDIFENGLSKLDEILEFCGVALNPNTIDTNQLDRNSASSKFSLSGSWPRAIRANVLKRCGPLMAEYGYDP